ncbi:MAG TPA: hypothetical protein VEA69_12555 [Tepidisphaeraceae bacterium]|nr:hypothetical protein [Tepidisphaeraceae bacterium]
MDAEKLQLEYAPAEPSRKSRVRRWAVLVLVVLAGVVALRHGADVASAVQRRWVQSRCATFEYAADTVIYESDKAAGDALLRRQTGDYVRLMDTSVWPSEAVVRSEPGAWASLKKMMFGGRAFWPPGPPSPKLMVHKLTMPGGEGRIVAIILAPELPNANGVRSRAPALQLVAAVVRPARDWSDSPRWDGNSGNLAAGFERARRLRFYAARLDPEFANRFSIRYEMDGQPGHVDGRLESDGAVYMVVRDGPARAR